MTTQAKHPECGWEHGDGSAPCNLPFGHAGRHTIAGTQAKSTTNEPILDSLVAALARLALEAEHFRANRIGERFLITAIKRANDVLAREAKP